jgi:hypothetical protein
MSNKSVQAVHPLTEQDAGYAQGVNTRLLITIIKMPMIGDFYSLYSGRLPALMKNTLLWHPVCNEKDNNY